MSRRLGTLLAGVLLLSGCTAGGGGAEVASAGGGAATPSASAAISDEERARQFTACMRQNGIQLDDPGNGKLGQVRTADKRKYAAAEEKCRHLLPNGGAPPTVSAVDLDKLRQYAACMREHGLPDFPDPAPNGRFEMDLATGRAVKASQRFRAATEACAQFLPEGGRGKGKS